MITLKPRHVVELEAENEDFSASVVQWLWNSVLTDQWGSITLLMLVLPLLYALNMFTFLSLRSVDNPRMLNLSPTANRLSIPFIRLGSMETTNFVGHNANPVVNGDAELVAWCDYRKAGDQSGGKIAGEGAIDL